MAARILAVIDRRYPRAAADQHSDLLDFCVGLRTRFGRIDLVLRGSAVACAVRPAQAAPHGNGSPDQHRQLRALIRSGVRVWADRADLAAVGYPDRPLLADVVVTDTDALAARWHEYEKVWFL